MKKLITGYVSGSIHCLGNLNCVSFSPSTQSIERIQLLHGRERKILYKYINRIQPGVQCSRHKYGVPNASSGRKADKLEEPIVLTPILNYSLMLHTDPGKSPATIKGPCEWNLSSYIFTKNWTCYDHLPNMLSCLVFCR
jgi:hypothetical protein